jgi:hypothetical protein
MKKIEDHYANEVAVERKSSDIIDKTVNMSYIYWITAKPINYVRVKGRVKSECKEDAKSG